MPVSAEHLAAFVLASVILLVIPGPTIIMVITQALAHGRKVAIASVLGVDPKVPSGLLLRPAANKSVDLELVCQRPGIRNRQVAQEQSDG